MEQQEDRDLLITMRERLNFYLERNDKFMLEVSSRLASIEASKASLSTQKDHEDRIRRLERLGFMAIGIIGLIQLIGIGAILKLLQ